VLSSLLKDRQDVLDLQREQDKRDILESFISYACMGGPQIGSGTMLARAGYAYTTMPIKAFRAVAQGATVNETFWAFWELATLQKGARNELSNYRHGRNTHERPLDPANGRLTQLETLVR